MSRRRSRSAPVTRRPPSASKPGRYTAPKPQAAKHSPPWIPATMFACLGFGVAVIIADFLELLPGGQRTSYLLLGLGLLIGGFAFSTQYK